jgi:HAMP domain-containing protein
MLPTTREEMPGQEPGQFDAGDVAAERAASAAEIAAQSAQRAASAAERVGAWMALLVSRATQTPPTQALPEGTPEAMQRVESSQLHHRPGQGIASNIKRAATSVGQRISDLSDGRYGLEAAGSSKAEIRSAKKAQKRLERQVRKEIKAEQARGEVRWFPWVVGMSLGLVVGTVGVVYWQRRRLQRLWGQTSQRLQQATGEMRQRLEASRQQPPMMQPGMSAETPEYKRRDSVDSLSDTMNQQVNGRMETPLP